MELYPCKSGLGGMEPVALVNHNVCIQYTTAKLYRKVTFVEPIPPFQFLDIGAIAAQTVSSRTQGQNLDLYDAEFGQWRWYPLDNVQIRLWLPNTNGKAALRNLQVTLDTQIVTRDPDLHMTEFFAWEDKSPWFEAINFMDYGITQCRLVAMGFRYVTEPLPKATVDKIQAGSEACVYLSASGHAGGVE